MQFQSISWMWHKIQMTRGLLKLRSGATDEAESMFLTGLKVAEEKGEYGLKGQYSLHLAELKLHLHQTEEAMQFADAATQIAQEYQLWELVLC